MGTNSRITITHSPANKKLRVSSMAPRINNGFSAFFLQDDSQRWQASTQTQLFQHAVVKRMLKDTDVLQLLHFMDKETGRRNG